MLPTHALSWFVSCLGRRRGCWRFAGGGLAPEGGAPNEIKPRANLTAADFYPLAPGWKWAYDVEKDGINILATYAVVERTGDTAVVQTGDEKLTYAVTPDGIVQKDGGMIGDYIIKTP